MVSGGHNKKSIQQHKEEASYRRSRHGTEVIGYTLPKMPKPPDVSFKPTVPIDFDDIIASTWGVPLWDALDKFPRKLTKREAQKWVWDASDELAIRNGCRFDIKRALHLAFVLRDNLQLWEGRWAGEPMILRTWQVECFLRIFGWVRPDKQLGHVRRFTKAATWVPKKNGKSPGAAAIGLYLWRWDGIWVDGRVKKEQGQHVWSIAASGVQAKQLVHRHAVNMANCSGGLAQEFENKEIKHNLSTDTLVHMPSRSTYEILSGDNVATLRSREGLNGCVICDEAHVVDQATVDVTTDMGASRDQPMWFQISTYGNEGGYGKNDLERGKAIACGNIEQDSFFFRTYESPADLTDEQAADPENWEACNPMYGATVSEQQFKDSYMACKDDPQALSGFKQRRLNIWQKSANPMFLMWHWVQAADLSLEWDEIQSVGGGAGLDLAASEDWAAFAVAWNEEELLKVWVQLWTSQGWIEENGHRDEFQRWANEGWLRIHDGEAVDFAMIEENVRDLMKWTRAQNLGYDKMFAMQMAQNLEKRLSRVGIYSFGQAIEAYGRGTAELKNALRHGRFRHPNNPALNWQAGHVESQVKGNFEKPIKRSGWKKVDAIQAIVMAIDVKKYAKKPSKPWMVLV